MIKEIEGRIYSEILSDWQSFPTLRFLKMNTPISGSGVGGKVIFFIFLGDSIEPSYVVKMIRMKRDIDVIKRSFEKLKKINDLTKKSDCDGIFPEAILINEQLEYSWCVESFCSGRKSILEKDLSLIFNSYIFLSKILNKTPIEHLVLNIEYARNIISQLNGKSDILLWLNEYCNEIFKGSNITTLKVLQHGDFTKDNIIIHNDRIKIIDCDIFGDILVPGYDIFHLLLRSKISNKGDYLKKYFNILNIDLFLDKRLLFIYFLHELLIKKDYVLINETKESMVKKIESVFNLFLD